MKNKNAQIGEHPADDLLHIRCTKPEKKNWRRAAKRDQKKLSAWVRLWLNTGSEMK